jgi:hypothetical protein
VKVARLDVGILYRCSKDEAEMTGSAARDLGYYNNACHPLNSTLTPFLINGRAGVDLDVENSGDRRQVRYVPDLKTGCITEKEKWAGERNKCQFANVRLTERIEMK